VDAPPAQIGGSGLSPPRRITTDRLVVRCWEPGDAPLLKEAVDSSLDHLREFMSWAWEAPEPLDATRERLQLFRSQFESGENFVYGLFTPEETEVFGGAGLHRRVGPGAFEIGYWIRASRVRQGLVSEAAGALTCAAFEKCDVDLVEIRIDPQNVASLGVASKLGFKRDATLRRRIPPQRPRGERRDAVIFSLFADEYPGSPAARLRVSYS
jgi:RimJ/RimL family protein N-acetyltransferase